jgi:hypothetical protein
VQAAGDLVADLLQGAATGDDDYARRLKALADKPEG